MPTLYPPHRRTGRREAVAGSSISIIMRLRPVVEIVTVVAVTGLLLEVSRIHFWALMAAGVVATVWVLGRSHP